MIPLKPHAAFPAKASFARSMRYEIRRSRDDNTGSYRLPADQPQHNGLETGYKTKEQAWAACDQINAPNGACIIIDVRRTVLEDLIESERGSWEDIEAHEEVGISGDRRAEFHVFAIAQRHRSRLIIRCREEAEDAYYAVCSGTFSIMGLACYRAAVRIADALREYAEPETVKMWPAPRKPSLYRTKWKV